MSVGAMGGVRTPQVDKAGIVGAGIGTAVGVGVAAATMKSLSFPRPVGIVAGAVIGGPIAAVSLMNNHGEPNKAWQSMAIGAAPLAVIGGALGAFGAAWDGSMGSSYSKLGAVAAIATGAITFGLAGGAIGGITHWASTPSGD